MQEDSRPIRAPAPTVARLIRPATDQRQIILLRVSFRLASFRR
jgi:hypothetical protein